jgi:hypothetical protein
MALGAERAWADEGPIFAWRGDALPRVGNYQGVAVTRAAEGAWLYLTDRSQPGLLVEWRDGQARQLPLPATGGSAGAEAGAAWADADGDGDPDLLVTRYGAPNRWYRNQGDSLFTESAAACGLADRGASQGCAWADYDADGDLDVYGVRQSQTNRLWRGEGGHFTDVALAAGVADGGPSMAAAWADYDRDGDLDLFLGRDRAPARLYQSRGDGAFVEVAAAAGLADDGPAAGCSWVDYDSDGDWDLSLTRYAAPDRLYRYDASTGHFDDVAAQLGLDDPGPGRLAAWGDYDRDGDLDVYVVRGGGDAADTSQLYRNDGTRFTCVTAAAGLLDPGSSTPGSDRGAVWWDEDEDGDLDLLVVADGGPVRLWENRGRTGALRPTWLSLELRQRGRNTQGLGAEATLWIAGAPQRRHVGLAENYLSQGVAAAYWGVAGPRPDSLVVTWPDGLQQRPSWALGRHLVVARPGSLVVATPPTLAVGRVPVDSAALAVVQLRSTAEVQVLQVLAAPAINPQVRATVMLRLDSTLVLAPGNNLAVPVVVTPLLPGPFSFRLVVQTRTDTLEVAAEGIGEPARQAARPAPALADRGVEGAAAAAGEHEVEGTPAAGAPAGGDRQTAALASGETTGSEDWPASEPETDSGETAVDEPGDLNVAPAEGETETDGEEAAASGVDGAPTVAGRREVEGTPAAGAPVVGNQETAALADSGDGAAPGVSAPARPLRRPATAVPGPGPPRRPRVVAMTAGAVVAGVALWVDGERDLTTRLHRYQQSRVPERADAYWSAARRAQRQRTLGQVTVGSAIGCLGYWAWQWQRLDAASTWARTPQRPAAKWATGLTPAGVWFEWGR